MLIQYCILLTCFWYNNILTDVACMLSFQLHVSSMRDEMLRKEKESGDYKERMTEKEEKIRQLTETMRSQNIQMEILERELKGGVVSAQSTADTVQNLTKADALVSILIHVSKLTAELDDANRQRHQMMIKSENAYQEANRMQESIRKLKSKIVSNKLSTL